MLDYQVISKNIITEEDMYAMIALYKKHSPTYTAFDTETTGLHIISDVPFLFQFGWIQDKTIYTFVIDLELNEIISKRTINIWNNLAKDAKYLAGHNIGYDLHMLENINMPYSHINTIDTITCIRFAHDNIPTRHGGVNLGLKNYAYRYIDRSAKAHDKLLQRERSAIAKDLNKKLQDRFKATSKETIPEEYNSWTVKAIQDITKDTLFLATDLPCKELTQAYQLWLDEDLPAQISQVVQGRVSTKDVPYNILNRKNITDYGHYDIVWTLAVLVKTLPIIEQRENLPALKIERDLIPVFHDMERVGFDADQVYLSKAKEVLRDYIIKRRTDLLRLTQIDFSISQYLVIKDILNDKYKLGVESTGADVLDSILLDLDNDSEPFEFITIIQELRTLEKWYSTYLIKLEHDLIKSDKLYTQINSVGAASLRVTSNFQQFPKGAIFNSAGEELFNPRRIIKVPPGNKDIFYMDYSQIELRIQAMYTILLENPDMNLCRAYMPYKCYRLNKLNDSEEFNPNDPTHIKAWQGEWFHNEDDKPWHPIDLHGATTKAAFDIDEDHPDFKKLRSIGKRINFAKNYGATIKVTRKIVHQIIPDATEEEIQKIDGAYYKAFPGIRTYQDYCYKLANHQSYATNLLGPKYWNVNGHKLINMLIQGAGAVFLKLKMIDLHKYLEDYHTEMQMNIHDEISFIYDHRDPIEIFKEIKAIMEVWDDAPIPIVADVERTTTYWSEKEDYEL